MNFNMEKLQRSIIHLEKPDGEHLYFGNAKALCDNVSYEILGASYNYIRNNLGKDNRLQTKTGCILRKGALISSTKKRNSESISHPYRLDNRKE